ncbi:hypothetical protein Ae168Ps1_1309c [Pseudonocardia sp. Ae168_Ps1]|nr:hypothetical protein Ae168Ps1_1309c [Pseudonocardia sp. Ae168_Ps1]
MTRSTDPGLSRRSDARTGLVLIIMIGTRPVSVS